MGSDNESGRIDIFLRELQDTPNNRGLVVIYTGDNKERLGNILGHIKGIKHYVFSRKLDPERISFLITEGKSTLYKELWLIPEGKNAPEFKSLSLKLNDDIFSRRYYYAASCISCEPTVPSLESGRVDFKFFTDLLKKNKKVRGLIIVTRDNLRYAVTLRKTLMKDYGLHFNRISIKFSDSQLNRARFYIIPA